jgi:hypothetical protein
MTDGLKGSDRDLIEELTQNFPGCTEENHENPLVVLRGVPDEIRTEGLPNTSLEHFDLDQRVRSCGIEKTQEVVQLG